MTDFMPMQNSVPVDDAANANEQRMTRALHMIERLQSRLKKLEAAEAEPIAIIGMGCRFPGDANDPATFWQNLLQGKDGIGPVPPDRWDADHYHNPDPDAAAGIVSREGGFIADLDQFDAAFFGISPKEAASLDPQQRLLLEVGWEALEDAGQTPDHWQGKSVGVFIGISSNDYSRLLLNRPEEDIDAYLATGNAHSVAAGRLSFCFGFTGPSLIVDTACSSSLVAVHLACQSLRNGECTMALVGGVNRILNPDGSLIFSRAHMLAPDGRCKVFDERADGFSRAEGCGVVILKRLSDARRDGDQVLAVIRGSAVNQDGRSSGLTVPNGPAQQAVIRAALQQAGVQTDDVDYIEAHGTGTALGDPIEAGALSAVFGPGRNRPLWIGSVKANLGHMEAAAGIGGLIKMVQALRYGQLPRQLHFHRPNPHIDWKAMSLQVLQSNQSWQHNDQKLAGVSSFGFSGTNAHVLLQGVTAQHNETLAEDSADVLMLSARDPVALQQLAQRYGNLLQHPAVHWRTLCHAAMSRRTRFAYRLAVPATSSTEAALHLQRYVEGDADSGGVLQSSDRVASNPRVAFLFTGQGAQYVGMGRHLFASEPVFRAVLEQCDLQLKTEEGWSLLELMYAESGEQDLLNQTRFTQPALFAIGVALAGLWKSRGVTPNALLGHSIGELAAAVTGGAIDLQSGLRLAAARGRLMQALPAGGAMAVVMTPAVAIEPLLPKGVVIAAINGPKVCVVSGIGAVLETFIERLREQGVSSAKLNVSHAFHSPLMDPMLGAFESVLSQQDLHSLRLPFYSTLTGKRVASESESLDTRYWLDHVRQPVQFEAAFQALLDDGVDVVIEIGPQPHLLALTKRFSGIGSLIGLPSLRPGMDDGMCMARSQAQLFVAGASLRRTDAAPHFPLPLYPFQRQRYWFSSSPLVGNGGHQQRSFALSVGKHPLLGNRLSLAGSDETRYQSLIDPVEMLWPAQHQVFGVTVLPAAGFLEMALQAAAGTQRQLNNMDFHQALTLDGSRQVQAVLSPQATAQEIRIYSAPVVDGCGESDWTLHASGLLVEPQDSTDSKFDIHLDRIRSHCATSVDVSTCYQRLAEQGVGYGLLFKALKSVHVATGAAQLISHIVLPVSLQHEASVYRLHPVLLDACLQSIAALFVDSSEDATYLPASINRLVWQAGAPVALSECWCHLMARRGERTLAVDMTLFGPAGAPVARLEGLQLRPAALRQIQPKVAKQDLHEWLYRVDWQILPLRDCSQLPSPEELAEQSRSLFAEIVATTECQDYLDLLPQLDMLARQYACRVLADVELAAWNTVSDSHRAFFVHLQRLAENVPLLSVAELDNCWQSLQSDFPAADAELNLLRRCANGMADVLQGTTTALELLFPGGDGSELTRLYETSPGANLMNRLAHQALSACLPVLTDGANLLEVGAGTGGTTAHLLPLFAGANHHYHFTDLSPSLLAGARERFGVRPNIDFQPLDIGIEPVAQGMQTGSVDFLVAANVLHATPDICASLRHCAQMLAPGGHLILLEITQPLAFLDLIFGLTDGWWAFRDSTLRSQHPLMSAEQWRAVLLGCGFDSVTCLGEANAHAARLPQSVLVARRAPAPVANVKIFSVNEHPLLASLKESMKQCELHEMPDSLESAHQTLQMNSADLAVVLADARDASLDDQSDMKGLLHLVQAMVKLPHPPQLVLITQGAAGPKNSVTMPAQSAIWGMGRVISLEHPELRCTRIDLDPAQPNAEKILTLQKELQSFSDENTISWRNGERHVARLAHADDVVIPSVDMPSNTPRMLVSGSNSSPDDLQLQPMQRRAPESHEVEIQVQAAGLNLIDVLDVLGVLPFERGWLGVECTGIVTAVGSSVHDLQLGDAVLGLAPGSFRDYVTADRRWVTKRPSRLGAVAAATIPACFLTARQTLIETAKLKAGERVLIHAAAGGTGMAAMAVALLQGAEVYATASSGKWRQVMTHGAYRVMNSRTLGFSSDVQQAGGVDVVLNSLSGDFIPASLDCLRPGGRFIEIGKRDIWTAEQVVQRRPDVHYHCVDLMSIAQQNPAHIQSLLETLCAQFEKGDLQPLPARAFPLARASTAFRTLQRASHVGKLVLTAAPERAAIKPDASYLVTGGLGGLGMLTARWLVEQGARTLVLIGRRAPPPDVQRQVKRWHEAGVRVEVLSLDVSDASAMQSLFTRIEREFPPLRGIFHAAGVLSDGVIAQLDWKRFSTVLAPKMHGAWHLHQLSKFLPLDFFVLYSSAASLFGSPGQASHVAANSFLDGLAQYRRSQGLAGISINWGPWRDIGAAAAENTHRHMQSRGIGGIAPDDGMKLFDALVTSTDQAQIGVVPVRWAELGMTGAESDAFFAAFRNAMRPSDSRKVSVTKQKLPDPQWQRLGSLAPRQRQTMLERLLQDELAAVLEMPTDQKPNLRTGFFDLGLDSLMAIELRNRLTRLCGITLSSAAIFEYPNISALASHLLERLNSEQTRHSTSVEPARNTITPILPNNATNSLQNIEADIAAELAALDALLEQP